MFITNIQCTLGLGFVGLYESIALRRPCAVRVLDDEDVLERHVSLHVRRVQRGVLAAGGRALVRHPSLMLDLEKKRGKLMKWCEIWISLL